ncbi:hypothetical protein SNE40_004798 [Patella caerulea]|uniref:Uncharacterized protein n=1 Tax=Patella caerulea TaxID=87958 RepID=A0AAN8PYJ7_PATCE
MYNECETCKDQWLENNMPREKMERVVYYYQWISKKEQRVRTTANGKETFDVKITVKDSFESTLWDVKETSEKDMKDRFSVHLYIIQHQYKVLRKLRSALCDDETMIHIDFSENYSRKYSEEVESVHFRASRN